MQVEVLPNVGSAVTLVNDGSETTQKLMAEADWGNAVWEHQFSGPRGTQGARPASGVPQNRPLILPFRVYGTSKDNLIANMNAIIGVGELLRRYGGRVRVKPTGATHSVYFDVMTGSAELREWGNRAESNQIAGMVLSATCAPYVQGTAMSAMTFSSQTLPQKLVLGTTIPGDAPALCDVSVRTSAGAAAPIWALIGWSERPGAPLGGSVAPFGILEAESGTGLSTWAVTADADYRGSSGLQLTASGAGTSAVDFVVDPSVLRRDDYTLGDVDVEVWARVELASALVSPKIVLSARPDAGTSFGSERYSDEWGSAGKLLTKPSSGTVFRFVRLGTLSLVSDPSRQIAWRIRLAGSWAAGSTGIFGLDYLCLVPSRKRALSPTGKANDSSYPKFIASTSDTTKTIRSDLSGLVASAAATAFPDHGLGGLLLELPPGDVDVLVKLSSLVPDDPTSDTTSEQEEHSGSTVTFNVTPRWALFKGV